MRLVPSLAVLVACAAPLAAQGTLEGRAVNDSTGFGVAGVEVVIQATGARLQTDAEGRFRAPGIPLGVGYVSLRKIGFRPVRLKTMVFGPDTIDIEVRMRPTVTELEPIEVTAAAVPPGMQGFAERRAGGEGEFIDWHVLREAEHRRVSDLMRSVRGVTIVPVGARMVAATSRGRCPMAVWVDGVRMYTPGSGGPVPSIDDFPVTQLEAIEVYRGAAETPGELGGTGAGCGTIVLWTRRR